MSITDEQLAQQLPHNHGFKPFWRVRWKFEFSDKRPPVYGQWSGDAISAWKVDKRNLMYAVIEGEKIGSWCQKEFLRIPGHAYATAKWVAATSVYTDFASGRVANKPTDILGLTFHTNEEAITVFVNGSIERRPLGAEAKKFKLREHTTEVK